jgi:hypothetical protein
MKEEFEDKKMNFIKEVYRLLFLPDSKYWFY